MNQSDKNNYRLLCDNIQAVLADGYDWEHDVYCVAINPATYEVVATPVKDEKAQTPEGWVQEVLLDDEWETICECAWQYFDIRS